MERLKSTLPSSYLIIRCCSLIVCRFEENIFYLFVYVCSLLNADFASAAVLISFGAVLGVTTPLQLIVMALCEIAIFSANEWLGLDVIKVISS